MISIASTDGSNIDPAHLLALYEAVGWTEYTSDPGGLRAAIAGSTTVVAASDDGILVGLARVISDNASVCYLQDVLVLPAYQRRGIGRELVTMVLAPHGHVRRKILLTDDEPRQKAFYEALGFFEVGPGGANTLRAFVRDDRDPGG